MKNKIGKIIFSFFLLFCYFQNGLSVFAQNTNLLKKLNELENSIVINDKDIRVIKIKNYLKGYPLENSAKDFVRIAEKYNLGKHVYLVVAISGVESTFGQFIPYESYNAWGYGIPTGAQSGIVFENWAEGIETVTKALKTEKYYLNNLEDINSWETEELVNKLGPVYAASPTWATKVLFFMNKIESASATPSSVNNLSPHF